MVGRWGLSGLNGLCGRARLVVSHSLGGVNVPQQITKQSFLENLDLCESAVSRIVYVTTQDVPAYL